MNWDRACLHVTSSVAGRGAMRVVSDAISVLLREDVRMLSISRSHSSERSSCFSSRTGGRFKLL